MNRKGGSQWQHMFELSKNVIPSIERRKKQAQKLVQVDALEILCNTLQHS